MGRRYPRILKFVSEMPWAILPARLETIVELLELRAAGQMFTDEEIQQRIGAGPRSALGATAGAVAVLPLFGVISPRMDVMTQISGGTSATAFGKVFRAAIADPDITAVVLDVDSPGGNVFGIEELAAVIRGGRGRKPIIAVANTVMASAAYWIGSQADEILASPSSQVGSIGVIGVHQDVSEAEEKIGIKTTLITAGKFKGDGNEHEPLSDTARAAMQQMVDSYYAAFVRDVGRGRAVPAAKVRDGYGEGRVLGAQDALRAGLVDRIGTLEDAIALAGKSASGGRQPLAARGVSHLDAAHAALQAAEAEAAQVEPDENGNCPEGYEKGDDGFCHLIPAPDPAEAAAHAEREDFRRRLAAHAQP